MVLTPIQLNVLVVTGGLFVGFILGYFIGKWRAKDKKEPTAEILIQDQVKLDNIKQTPKEEVAPGNIGAAARNEIRDIQPMEDVTNLEEQVKAKMKKPKNAFDNASIVKVKVKKKEYDYLDLTQ